MAVVTGLGRANFSKLAKKKPGGRKSPISGGVMEFTIYIYIYIHIYIYESSDDYPSRNWRFNVLT